MNYNLNLCFEFIYASISWTVWVCVSMCLCMWHEIIHVSISFKPSGRKRPPYPIWLFQLAVSWNLIVLKRIFAGGMTTDGHIRPCLHFFPLHGKVLLLKLVSSIKFLSKCAHIIEFTTGCLINLACSSDFWHLNCP